MRITRVEVAAVDPARTGELRERAGHLRLCLTGAPDASEAHWIYLGEDLEVIGTDGRRARGEVRDLVPESFRLAGADGVRWVRVWDVVEVRRPGGALPHGIR